MVPMYLNVESKKTIFLRKLLIPKEKKIRFKGGFYKGCKRDLECYVTEPLRLTYNPENLEDLLSGFCNYGANKPIDTVSFTKIDNGMRITFSALIEVEFFVGFFVDSEILKLIVLFLNSLPIGCVFFEKNSFPLKEKDKYLKTIICNSKNKIVY